MVLLLLLQSSPLLQRRGVLHPTLLRLRLLLLLLLLVGELLLHGEGERIHCSSSTRGTGVRVRVCMRVWAAGSLAQVVMRKHRQVA